MQGDVSQRARNCFIFEFFVTETDTAKRKLFQFRLQLGEKERRKQKCQVLSPQSKAVEDVGGES